MFRIDTTWMDEDMDDWVSSTNVSLQVRHRVVTTRPSPWLTIHKARFLQDMLGLRGMWATMLAPI